MATGSTRTTLGRNVSIYRSYTENANLSSTLYNAPSQFKLGIANGTPSIGDTNLAFPIPILDGTVCDTGANTLTGSSGGTNSTNNTTTYKQGASQVDNTSQNLITNTGSATKQWTKTGIATSVVTTQPFGMWLYIKDATALAKFLTAGTALDVRFGSDASNYYKYTRTAGQLTTGWNWISSNTSNVSTLTTTGTPGTLSRFDIIITTNNSTDAFVAGDVLYDLLRQWATTDVAQNMVAGYPTFDYTQNQVTMRFLVNSTQASGFDLNGMGVFNKDTSPLMTDEHTYTTASKTNSDEFVYVVKNRNV